MTRRSVVVVKVAIWAACVAPLVLLFLRERFGFAGGLGPNPPEFVLDVCGKTGLNLLMLTLCITPIRRSTGWNRLVQFRRLLGLFAFFYLVLHFLTYALLDRGLLVYDARTVLGTLGEDLALRPYITVGFTALLMLVPLAVTSTRGFQRRLGRSWAKLHRLVYPAAILAVVHYWWQVKIDVAEPLLYAFLLTVLLGVRLQHRRSVNTKATVTASDQRVEPPQASQKTGR